VAWRARDRLKLVDPAIEYRWTDTNTWPRWERAQIAWLAETGIHSELADREGNMLRHVGFNTPA
jgi:hypothetical protein